MGSAYGYVQWNRSASARIASLPALSSSSACCSSKNASCAEGAKNTSIFTGASPTTAQPWSVAFGAEHERASAAPQRTVADDELALALEHVERLGQLVIPVR